MKTSISYLWRWDAEIGRGAYAAIGVIGFGIKHNLDRLIASVIFHRRWDIFNYWIPPERLLRPGLLAPEDLAFVATLIVAAFPFIWIGTALTVRRLRSIGLPLWLALLFFVPALNLLFFLLMSTLPSKTWGATSALTAPPSSPFLDRLMPSHSLGSAAAATLLVVPMGLAATLLSTEVFRSYGWGIFVALPFCLGLGAALLHGYRAPRCLPSCLGVAIAATAMLGMGLVLLAVEGLICVIMAAGIGLPLAAMGGAIGYIIQRRPRLMRSAPSTLAVVVFFIPGFMASENARKADAPLLVVQTAIEIDAPPERVWKEVVSFAEIAEPTEMIFRLGIAYPMRATIAGQGPGAVRRCEFSTGAFIEPIEVWDAPRRLKFAVTANPPSMEEWTPYRSVHAPHLEGFLVSRQGQFLLTPLPSGHTRLEGTTWYQHHMWPAAYWQLWSDAIIHRIHMRVLDHIKCSAEAARIEDAQ